MLKFPSATKINKDMSYANGCISEYIGCHIFESVGIPVQKTLLGTYTKNGKEKIVVACKDFTEQGLVLQDFASLKNTIIDSVHNGYGTELSDIEKTFEEQTAMDSQMLSNWFWNMFIVDETPYISDFQKKFYKTMIRERKERILDFSYQKLKKRERFKNHERN